MRYLYLFQTFVFLVDLYSRTFASLFFSKQRVDLIAFQGIPLGGVGGPEKDLSVFGSEKNQVLRWISLGIMVIRLA